jgi:hypothetical protein
MLQFTNESAYLTRNQPIFRQSKKNPAEPSLRDFDGLKKLCVLWPSYASNKGQKTPIPSLDTDSIVGTALAKAASCPDRRPFERQSQPALPMPF